MPINKCLCRDVPVPELNKSHVLLLHGPADAVKAVTDALSEVAPQCVRVFRSQPTQADESGEAGKSSEKVSEKNAEADTPEKRLERLIGSAVVHSAPGSVSVVSLNQPYDVAVVDSVIAGLRDPQLVEAILGKADREPDVPSSAKKTVVKKGGAKGAKTPTTSSASSSPVLISSILLHQPISFIVSHAPSAEKAAHDLVDYGMLFKGVAHCSVNAVDEINYKTLQDVISLATRRFQEAASAIIQVVEGHIAPALGFMPMTKAALLANSPDKAFIIPQSGQFTAVLTVNDNNSQAVAKRILTSMHRSE